LNQKEIELNSNYNLIDKIEEIRNILEKTKNNRTKDNIKFLYNNFKVFNFFQSGISNYGAEIIYSLLECCHLLELPTNSVILNTKENAKSAYILLSGKVLISTKQAIFREINNPRKKTNSKQLISNIQGTLNNFLELFEKRKSLNFIQNESEGDLEELKNKEENSRYEYWNVKIGDMFGDKSLIERKIR
jgi:hypothetical protein